MLTIRNTTRLSVSITLVTTPPGGHAPPTHGPAPTHRPLPAQDPSPGQPAAPAYTGQVAAMSVSDERKWGMFAHLAPFVGALIGLPFLGPLVVFALHRHGLSC